MTEVGSTPSSRAMRRSSTSSARLLWLSAALAGVCGCERRTPRAPLDFTVSLQTEGCSQELSEVVLQLDANASERKQAYRFQVDPSQRVLQGTIRDLPEGSYQASAIGRTSDGKNTCSRSATVVVSSQGTGQAALKLTCDTGCTTLLPDASAVACPSLEPELPATTQFTSMPFRVAANQTQASGDAVWSSADLSFTNQRSEVRAQCRQATPRANAAVVASNAKCSVREAVSVKCVDAKVTALNENQLLEPDWRGATPGRRMPITRTVYRSSCDEVVKRQLGSARTCSSVGKDYCSCEWTGAPRGDAALPASFDGPVLGGAADEPVSAEALDELRNQLTELGRGYLGVPPKPGETLSALQTPTPSQPVRVAVIDTSRVPPYDSNGTPTQPTDNNLHGRAVALVIADTACSEFSSMKECPVKVYSYLALNVLGSHNGATQTLGVDDIHGGHAGTLTDLALAIRRAVDDWRRDAAKERLIINLSVGWDPVWGGVVDPVEGVTGTPALVLESLQYAHCAGALVFAAAGNRTTPLGSPTPETAIYPAAWATLAAPTLEQCQALGFRDAQPNPETPLLHAVGGLDYWGGQLMTGRARGLPLLATVGLHVVRREPYGTPHHTPTLTGTSMSTAAVSGIAANHWMHTPTLQAPQVAALLYELGQPTTHTANVCLGGQPCDAVHNVVLCRPGDDANHLGCSPTPPELEAYSSTPGFEDTTPVELHPLDADDSHAGDEPWVYPQPPDDPSCGVCQFQTINNKLDIHWVSSFDPKNITQLRIYLNKNNGYWTIPEGTAKKQSFRVTLNGANAQTSAGTVRYKYKLGPEVITVEEALVVP